MRTLAILYFLILSIPSVIERQADCLCQTNVTQRVSLCYVFAFSVMVFYLSFVFHHKDLWSVFECNTVW